MRGGGEGTPLMLKMSPQKKCISFCCYIHFLFHLQILKVLHRSGEDLTSLWNHSKRLFLQYYHNQPLSLLYLLNLDRLQSFHGLRILYSNILLKVELLRVSHALACQNRASLPVCTLQRIPKMSSESLRILPIQQIRNRGDRMD